MGDPILIIVPGPMSYIMYYVYVVVITSQSHREQPVNLFPLLTLKSA